MRIVLIVEDNPVQRKLYADGLRRYHTSFEVLTAENGQEAADILSSLAVDVVVTDLDMPVMGGFELLAHLQGAYPTLPAIVLTAMPAPGADPAAPEPSTLRVLHKPVSHEELAAVIHQALEAAGKGELGGVGLADLLAVLALEKRTCSLLASAEGRQGSLHFVSGQLVDAFIPDGELSGEEAVQAMSAWPDLRLEVKNARPGADEEPVAHLLEEAEPPQSEAGPEAALGALKADALAEARQGATLAKETPMSELRHDLETEAEALQAVMQRLKERAHAAEEALSAVMEEFAGFRKAQAGYQQAETRYLERQKQLEQRLQGAEQLAQQLLSVVKQVDEEKKPVQTR